MFGGPAGEQRSLLVREGVAQGGWWSDFHMARSFETGTLLNLVKPATLPPLGLVLVPRAADKQLDSQDCT